MSIKSIRKALEKHLQTLVPQLPTAFENAGFTPPVAEPGDATPTAGAWQQVRLMPGDPITPMDNLTFIEQGVFQVTICHPLGRGPRASDDRAEAIRAHFRRGTTLTADGISTTIVGVPRVTASLPADGHWQVPVSITWQAQVSQD